MRRSDFGAGGMSCEWQHSRVVDGLVALRTAFDMEDPMSCGSDSARDHQGSSSVRSAAGCPGFVGFGRRACGTVHALNVLACGADTLHHCCRVSIRQDQSSTTACGTRGGAPRVRRHNMVVSNINLSGGQW